MANSDAQARAAQDGGGRWDDLSSRRFRCSNAPSIRQNRAHVIQPHLIPHRFPFGAIRKTTPSQRRFVSGAYPRPFGAIRSRYCALHGLDFEHCLFFIFADRRQILAATEKRYPGEGVSYLEKFVQLSIDLPPHDSRDLTGLLPKTQNPDDQPLYAYWERLAEALGHNPRKLKKLWNRTRVCLDLVVEELNRTPSGIDGGGSRCIVLSHG